MEVKEILKLSDEDLQKKIVEQKKELINHKFNLNSSEEKDTSKVKKTKKLIAKLLTIQNEKRKTSD